jgi:cytochrome c
VTAATIIEIAPGKPGVSQPNVPPGQGGLSDQEAFDVAEYFTHWPRPETHDLSALDS